MHPARPASLLKTSKALVPSRRHSAVWLFHVVSFFFPKARRRREGFSMFFKLWALVFGARVGQVCGFLFVFVVPLLAWRQKSYCSVANSCVFVLLPLSLTGD